MARTTLVPVLMPPQAAANLAALNLTAIAAAGVAPAGTGTGNGVQFPNSPGQTFLLVSVGTTVTTPTIATGAVSAAVTLNALTASVLATLGPFWSAMFLAGTQLVGVDFSSVTNIKCVAVQLGAVY
jgi:hypothetical protein